MTVLHRLERYSGNPAEGNRSVRNQVRVLARPLGGAVEQLMQPDEVWLETSVAAMILAPHTWLAA